MIITVTLNPAMDLTLEVPGWESGELNRATAVRKSVGGKGINVSRVLRELGEPTVALTVVGSDTVQEFQRLARSAGFSIVYINMPGEMRTNIQIIDPASARSLKVNQPGTPMEASHLEHFRLLYKQQLQRARMVALGGSLPPGSPPNTYAALAAMATQRNRPVLIDAEGPALLEALAENPLVAKPNRQELEHTLDTTLSTTEEIVAAARELVARGARSAVVTDGADIVVGVWENECWIATPPRIEVQGTMGAGDSFAAGLLFGLAAKKSFPESLALGVAASAATCATPQGHIGTRAEVEALLPRVEVRRHRKGIGNRE